MPSKTIVYLSGPMSGRPDLNFRVFDMAAEKLREKGYRVINPADFGAKERHTWRDCLCRDLAMLAHADVIATLPNWASSKGATLEVRTAEELGIKVVSLYEMMILTTPIRVGADTPAKPIETESRKRKLSVWFQSWWSA